MHELSPPDASTQGSNTAIGVVAVDVILCDNIVHPGRLIPTWWYQRLP